MDIELTEIRADSTEQPALGINPNYVTDVTKLAESLSTKSDKRWAPRFVRASRIAFRVAVWTFLTGCAVWRARHSDVVPLEYFDSLPSVVIAIILNVTPNLAMTMKSVYVAFIGTCLAMAVCSVLFHALNPLIAEGSETMPVYPACPIGEKTEAIANQTINWYCSSSSGLLSKTNPSSPITWVTFLVFSVFSYGILSLNVIMPLKIFALVTSCTYLMEFANPLVDTRNHMNLTWTSNMTVSLVTQILGSSVAVLAVLLPPTTATQRSKVLVAKATKVTSELLCFLTHYYCGAHKTLQVNLWESMLERNRNDMAEALVHLDASWWEFFDWSKAGVTRLLLIEHLRMLKDLDRHLAVLRICVSREGFEEGHKEVMKQCQGSLKKLLSSVSNLLLCSLLAAKDGVITLHEKTLLQKESNVVHEAMMEVVKEWTEMQKGRDALHRDLRDESFYMLEMCTVGRLVTEFTDKIINDSQRPKPTNVALTGLRKVRDPSTYTADFNNFVKRSVLSLSISYWWSALFLDFNSALPINVVFMLSTHPGNALLLNLQKLQATVLGALAGTALYRVTHFCTVTQRMLRLSSLFFYEFVANFIAQYHVDYNLMGTLLAVFGGQKLLVPCKEDISKGELMAMQSGEFNGLMYFIFSATIVTCVDGVLKRESACDQAREYFEKALTSTFSNIKDFLEGKMKAGKAIWDETSAKTDAVEEDLKKALDLVASADTEPRFTKGPFQTALFTNLCEQTRSLQFHASTLIRRALGSAPGVFDVMTTCESFTEIKDDVKGMLDSAQKVVLGVVMYDDFGSQDPKQYDDVMKVRGFGGLDGLNKLVDEISNKLSKNPDVDTMEKDAESCMCAVIEMLDTLTQDVSNMMIGAVRKM